MFDHSFGAGNLRLHFKRGDFDDLKFEEWDSRKAEAVALARTKLDAIPAAIELRKMRVRKKDAVAPQSLADALILRKLAANLKRNLPTRLSGRSLAVKTLSGLLREGVPFRIYRLDVRDFYESFTKSDLLEKLDQLRSLTAETRNHVVTVLDRHEALGGSGLPRGLSVSAVLSDILMIDFDVSLSRREEVFFYHRYVDDMVIVTGGGERAADFRRWIADELPGTLKFNEAKTRVVEDLVRVSPKKTEKEVEVVVRFEYLGYEFAVRDPVSTKDFKTTPRTCCIEIAPKKVKKIKTRISRAMREFLKGGDATLLLQRIKYLSSNFTLIERSTGKRKLAGIYYSYPMLTAESESLRDLDRFVATAALKGVGRGLQPASSLLASWQLKKLLGSRFADGHRSGRFVHYNKLASKAVQECWEYE